MTYPCEIVEQPERTVLSIRTRSSMQNLPEQLGKGFQEIADYLASISEQPAGPPFVTYYNLDMLDLDIELGYPVSKAVAGQADMQLRKIPAGKAASCLYTGPYQDMAMAYDALTEWINENGYQATGTVREHYLNRPDLTSPEELQTLIEFPLE